jgi:hypothetical protein
MSTGTEIDIRDGKAQDNLPDVVIEAGAIASVVVNAPSGLANLGASNTVVNNNQASQNALSNQQAISKIGLAAISKAVQMVSTITPQQAQASRQILTDNSVAQSVIVPVPPLPIPRVLPSGTVYANAPLYLVYDNDLGFANIQGVAVNHVQNPLPAEATVYGKIPDLPLFFSYMADGVLIIDKGQT